jgi:prevent-host-death family protein
VKAIDMSREVPTIRGVVVGQSCKVLPADRCAGTLCRYVPATEAVMAEVTARDFNRDVSAAKRAASKGPVIITDRGEPSHVLLSIEDYHRLLADYRRLAQH